ncbi:metal ABC transporter substrate-binding protein [Butyrivibrio sp. AE3006]|uniref:metal ABC transporter substrate-binding protein n=1 Tax=Butyrivibrio sp. AE3006 TaxID=1280673 RepID=UPI0003FC9853|nr:metal ABC transporter substrate-binding protein [Butyrivibrio sp. AE3006]
MKRNISVFCAAIVMVWALSACGESAGENPEVPEVLTDSIESEEVPLSAAAGADDSISIVTTIFPEYDWVNEILGDNPANAEVTMLLDNGVDLHSYQPTAEDILKVATCDLFIYVGGESDEWVEDALKEATNENMVVINLLDVLGDDVKEEEVVEGMEAEEEGEEGEEGEEEPEYDEHVWLSLRNSEKLCEAIRDAIIMIDPDNTAVYAENADNYIAELKSLDTEYEKVVKDGTANTLVFGDRFPFRYLVDDYNLIYYAAFVGCSAETEASFETIAFLAGKVDELSLKNIMTIEGADHRIAETIKSSTEGKDQNILTMDSMQSTTSKDVAGGASYLGIMKNNLEVLKVALN